MELFLIIVISFITLVYYGLRGILQPSARKRSQERVQARAAEGKPPGFLAELFPDQPSNDPLAPFFRTEKEVRGSMEEVQWGEAEVTSPADNNREEDYREEDYSEEDFFGTGKSSSQTTSQGFSQKQRAPAAATTHHRRHSASRSDPKDPYQTANTLSDPHEIDPYATRGQRQQTQKNTAAYEENTSRLTERNAIEKAMLHRGYQPKAKESRRGAHPTPRRQGSPSGVGRTLVRERLQVSGRKRRAFLRQAIIANELLSKPVSLRDIEPPSGGRR